MVSEQHDKASSQSLEISQASDDPCINLQEAGGASSAPPTEEGSIQHTLLLEEEHIKKKACIDDDANLVMQKSGMPPSHRSSLSGEETLIDGEEASSPLSMEKQPKPTSSVDHGKVAQDEDDDEDEEGYSDKKPPSVALSEIIAHDEDGQNSNEIGVQAIEDYKQEQGRIRRDVEALLELERERISEMIDYYSRQLTYVPPEVDLTEYEPQELTKLNERLALYRIRAYELSVDTKLDKLDDASLMQHYPPPLLCDEGYFRYYEESLEWYFDDGLCNYAGFEDYQLIVLRDDVYHDWNFYCSTRNTYAEDLAYVQFCEAIENEIKWIEDYLQDSTLPWERVEYVAYIQALKIAAGFPNVSPSLLLTSFKEHIWSVKFDSMYKGLDVVYFEIWKRVAKQKMNFREALLEVYHGKMFPSGCREIELELDESTRWLFSMEDKYNAYVACIADSVSEDAARPLITEAVKKMYLKTMGYLDYARKKLDIAEEIGLTTKGRRSQSTPRCRGGHGEAKLELDS